MDRLPINKIKDKIYEAEGLLELLQLRPEKEEELIPMILERIDNARDMFAGYESSLKSNYDPLDPIVDDIADESVMSISEDDYEPDESMDSELYSVEDETDDSSYVCSSPEMETSESYSAVDSIQNKVENKSVDKPVEPVKQNSSEKKKVPAFCLNDRFRFRRSIFGGSDAEFNATMTHIASLDDYSEAEEFFLTDMGLDPADEDVADFLEIIRNYFGQ